MFVRNTRQKAVVATCSSAHEMRRAGAALAADFIFLHLSAQFSAGQTNNNAPSGPVPRQWIDADTGHRVTRVSYEPGSQALYSNRNAFTPDGKDMIYTSPFGIHVLNLATLTERVLVGGNVASLAVGTRTRRVFYNTGSNIYLNSVDIDTGAVTRVGTIPVLGEIISVNADETLLMGTAFERAGPTYTYFLARATRAATAEIKANPSETLSKDEIKTRAERMRLAAQIPEDIFTVNLQTGQVSTILKGTDWIDHAQFSPTDPALIMYNHEGPYSDVDRIWTIRSDGTQNQLIHQRTSKEESATREFWSRDGKTLWYEWQSPRGENFTLVGYDVATGKRKLYHLDKLDTSMYYNVADSGAFFCGSGRRSEAAHEKDATPGQIHASREWIEALYPILNTPQSGANPRYSKSFHYDNVADSTDPDKQYAGWFRRERLVNMYMNDYTKLEPNVRISPDNKYVIFTSNMFGPSYVFAVEVQ